MRAQKAKPVSAATRAMMDALEEQDAVAPEEDKLERARDLVKDLRDHRFTLDSLNEKVEEVKKGIRELEDHKIPSLFDEVGIPKIKIAAEGNMPAFEVDVIDRYYANIPAEKKSEAFDYLRKIKQDDLIKTEFKIAFGLRDAKAADRFRRSLEKADIQYSETNGVPWNTLTSWFKVEHKKKPLTAKAMDLLGATVGRVAKVVTQKEKK